MPLEGDTAGETSAPAEEAGDDDAPGDAERIAVLEAEVAELTELHARAVADLQNYRRRTEERWKERGRAQLAETIARCLPPLDDLNRALASADDDIAGHQWVEGIRLVQRKFGEMLANAGVEEDRRRGRGLRPAGARGRHLRARPGGPGRRPRARGLSHRELRAAARAGSGGRRRAGTGAVETNPGSGDGSLSAPPCMDDNRRGTPQGVRDG